jgi:hypothetical protein
MAMPSRSVQPAGKRLSYGGYGGSAGAQTRRLPARDTRDSAMCFRVAGAGRASTRSG